jgi:D-arabinose 1-dehydrogenase-like Zn-dependent alcohol dehydrogenase
MRAKANWLSAGKPITPGHQVVGVVEAVGERTRSETLAVASA